MTMTLESAIAEREWRKYEAWSEYVATHEATYANVGGVVVPMDYFQWLDYMGLD